MYYVLCRYIFIDVLIIFENTKVPGLAIVYTVLSVDIKMLSPRFLAD